MCRWRLAGGSSPSLGTGELQQEGWDTCALGLQPGWCQEGAAGLGRILPCPHVAWREGSSQRLLASWLASTQVMVPPLQKVENIQESLLTHEARPP